MVAGRRCSWLRIGCAELQGLRHSNLLRPIADAPRVERASEEADMSLRAAFAVAAAIVLSTAAAASAATKKQRVPRGSGPQAQATAPRSAAPFNPYSPSLTGAGSTGYNQSLMTWR
jgi:hypothetical protein